MKNERPDGPSRPSVRGGPAGPNRPKGPKGPGYRSGPSRVTLGDKIRGTSIRDRFKDGRFAKKDDDDMELEEFDGSVFETDVFGGRFEDDVKLVEGVDEIIEELDADGNVIDKTGWYDETMQYSPPQVRFAPAHIEFMATAICTVVPTGENTESGTIRLVQYPGYASMVKYDLAGLDAEADYSLRINKNGVLGDQCSKTGGEYNPMSEINQWGQWNPFQDPARGRLTMVQSDADGVIDGTQDVLLQNLDQYRSIMGRSISIFTGDDENALRGCCTISRNVDPENEKRKEEAAEAAAKALEEKAKEEAAKVVTESKGHYNGSSSSYGHHGPQNISWGNYSNDSYKGYGGNGSKGFRGGKINQNNMFGNSFNKNFGNFNGGW